jgi:heterotetrameric sarcosine oxidase gamma subunit
VRELASADAFEGLALPLTAGDATLAALPPAPRAAVAPFAGRREAVSHALRAWTGAGLPEPGRMEGAIAWSGIGQWLVTGREPGEVAERLHGLAAVTDQSDAWAGLRLTGGAAAEVLARLAPLDLHPSAFAPGAAARTLLRHVPLLMSRGETGFDLLVPRSYAGAAVEDLVRAMRLVAGRAAL